ncbi:MAG: nitrous oxide reductase accessory protein NosL [Bacteroidota bacterium]|nr:nitrous oxide reductase accessory protein NosL [Bacteroidota bacterium]
MTILTRLLTAIAALSMIAVIYLPIWRIELAAPQYPEGLYMDIWANKMGGNIDIINGLNHYIGMKTLHANEFIEFTILPYIFWGFAILGVLTAILNKKKIFFGYFSLFLLFAVVAMADFYRWEYNYGHNLSPDAPIQVPGQSYQPPLIGYKQLLNFGAYSIPDKGGWVMISSGVLLLLGVVVEKIKSRREKKSGIRSSVRPALVAFVIVAATMIGCATGPEPIRYGKEACDHCKMTLIDKKAGGEIVTAKGKIFRFDDTRCIIDYLASGAIKKDNEPKVYLVDYSGDGSFIPSDKAFLLKSDALHTPMGGNIAAFRDEASRQKVMEQVQGIPLTWAELTK